MAAGERALGPDVFARQAATSGESSRTRPYLRARFGLAQCLEDLDRREEAIQHYRELHPAQSRRQPGRPLLVPLALLLAGRDDEVAALIEQFGDEPTALWRYGRALVRLPA